VILDEPVNGLDTEGIRWIRSLLWTKLRSVHSTAWSLLATVALIVGVGALYSLLRVTRPPSDPAAVASFDATAVSLTGVQLAELAIGILGVLLVAGEYATGTIRGSLAALLRSTAGAIAGVLFAPQLLAGLLPAAWSDRIYPYLPVPAGVAVTAVQPDPAALAPWSGFALFCLYVAVVLALGAWRLRRRDA
jgi:ABC-type transport system involved in multi-copper enzyme maturation permease subunit